MSKYGRKVMNYDINENSKLFLNKLGKVKDEKMENCKRIKDRTCKQALEKDDVQKSQKGYFEELHNMDTCEFVNVWF